MKYLSASPKTTKKFGALFAKEIVKEKRRHAFVVALRGNLGAGKTTFIQGFARGLRIRHRLTSPTFLLMRNYKLRTKNFKLLYHMDAYRIKKPKELAVLGLKEILNNSKHIVLIEWAEKAKTLLPKNALWLTFEHGMQEHERTITIKQ